jgi:hypothetical protein
LPADEMVMLSAAHVLSLVEQTREVPRMRDELARLYQLTLRMEGGARQ